ncbi:MAG: RNA-binding domain-containing protein [Chloroflexia bacterium]
MKMDLHLHTPASSDYRDPGISYLDILKKAEERGLDMIAFADHNTIGGYAAMHREIETLTLLEKLNRINDQERATLNEYHRLLSRIVVLPAFEFTATFGFHILGIFPENTSVRKLEYLLLDLNVPEDRMVIGAPDVGSTSDVLRAYAGIAGAGGLAIAAHANSSNGVAMQGFPFGGQTKIAYTQDPNLAAIEVTDLEAGGRRTTASFFNGSKPEYPRRMHLIQGSDAHSLETEQMDSANKRLGVGARVTEILVKEASFAAFREILMGDDFTRIRPHRAVSAWEFAERARSEGPSLTQSFHERAMTKTNRTRPILHDIAAFANTSGGTIYVGVTPDNRVAVHGVERAEDDVRLLRADIQQSFDPPISVDFDVKQAGARAVIAIKVAEGRDTPYVYTPTGQIYIRAEDETVVAKRDEIINLVRKSGVVGAAPRPQSSLALPPPPAAAASAPSEARATPVPTVPEQGRWTREARPGSSAGSGQAPRSAEPAPPTRDRAIAEPGQQQERAYRPPAFPNLPPEKIKGRVQPMGGPPSAGSGGADTERLNWEEGGESAETANPEVVTTPLTTHQLEDYLENGANATVTLTPLQDTGRSRRRRGRGATEEAAAPEAESLEPAIMEAAPVAEAPAPEVAAPPARSSRSRRKGAAAVAEASETPAAEAAPPMEATVSSEHMTREEIVEAEAPRKGRRSRKATQQLEIEAPTAAAAATETGTEAILTEAEVEPGAQQPFEIAPEAPARKGRSRGKKSAGAESEAAPAQAMEAPPAPEQAESGRKRGRKSAKSSAASEPQQADLPNPPSTGVEIMSTEMRGTTRYHTMRDLRNQTTVHNVTRQSARRLWHYAIMQNEHGEPAMAEVMWHPQLPIGIWRRGQRAGAMRSDLVMRQPDGTLLVYYGVTDEGLHSPWQDLVDMAEEAGYEGPDSIGG